MSRLAQIWEELRWRKRRKADYERTFASDHGERTLADLYVACRAGVRVPDGIDALQMARELGRRDVWLHIQSHLQFDEDRETRLIRVHDKEREEYAA